MKAVKSAVMPTALVNPARRWARTLLILALAGLTVPLALIPVGGDALIVAGSLGGAWALIFGLSALIVRFAVAPQAERDLSEFQKTDFLAHWTYDPAEWRRFAEAEWRRNARKVWPPPRWAAGLLAAGLAVLGTGVALAEFLRPRWVVEEDVTLDIVTGVLTVGALFTVTLLCFAIPCALASLANWLDYRHTRNRVGEAYLGRQGVYLTGTDRKGAVSVSGGSGLDQIHLEVSEDGPAAVLCRFPSRAPDWARNSGPRWLRIPVPAGRLDEARRLVDELEPDVAVAAATAALARDPDDADAYLQRGDAYARKGDQARAAADYGQALRCDPEEAGLYHLKRGDAHARLGDAARAREDYGKALRHCDAVLKGLDGLDRAAALIERARALAGLGDQARGAADFAAAVAGCDAFLREAPDNAVAHDIRGDAHFHQGAYDRAIADFGRALELSPLLAADYLRKRAEAHERLGDGARARADRERAWRLDFDAQDG
jgi:tetratricopeptide (TPR) repeat protein